MSEARPMRKLAAIMAADVVGFSRLMGADETGTLRRLSLARADIIDPQISQHYGRIFKVMGDGLLVEFPSAVLGLSCAVEIQNRLDASNAALPAEERIVLRIGLHQGDVVVEGTDLLGDGVNVAARLEPLAEPGGICVSDRVREDAVGKLTLDMDDLGERELKNIFKPVRVHRVRLAMQTSHPPRPAPFSEAGEPPTRPARRAGEAAAQKPAIAVLPFETLGGADDIQVAFATGLVEDIIIALSRLRWLSVVPRNASSAFQGRTADFRYVARDLGVRYLVTGAVRQAGNRVRVTAQVIEARTGEHVWADRHESVLSDVFELQDRIAGLVAAAVQECLGPGGPPTRTERPLSGDDPSDDQPTVTFTRGMQHRLTVLGEQPLRRVILGDVPLTVGRMPPSLLILNGGEVSRSHCRLSLAGDQVLLTDLGSTNGTFVNDRRIAAPTRLTNGARVRVGPHILLYECQVEERLDPPRSLALSELPDSTCRT